MSAERAPAVPAGMDVAGKRVTVVGLGRFGGGTGVARWLCEQGAHVTISDRAPADSLADSVAEVAGLGLRLHLGSQLDADFADTDLVVLSPAVKPNAPPEAIAAAAGVPCTTEINLFLHRCRGVVVGITGTVGKSTTTAMIGEVLARRMPTHVGGNIGRSLLSELPAIGPGHAVVMELSSAQLHRLPEIAASPHVALVTNLMPNHIDWHGSYEAYVQAKKNLFRFQGPGDVLVLNAADAVTSAWAGQARGHVEFFDPAGEPFELALVGRHNQTNAQAAWAAARQLGVDRATASAALAAFGGLEHRLQFVATRGGVRYYNDSKCTTPEGCIVALNAFPPRSAVFIVGGSSKNVPFDAMGQALVDRAGAVVAVGATAEKIIAATLAARTGQEPPVRHAATFAEAVSAARGLAKPGQAVVLSPACASFDLFVNYEQRGQTFVELVHAMPE
jgi:UDP-N-acetylmuramoylalanine--D-glutamate ligase